MIPLAHTQTEPEPPAIALAAIVMEANTALELDGTWFEDPACLCPIENDEAQDH
jgi:hypothetical protein